MVETLSALNNSIVIGANVPSNKVVSIRSVFARGKNLGTNDSPSSGLMKRVEFAHIGNTANPFTVLFTNDFQTIINTGNLTYPLIPGAEIIVSVPGLTSNQSIELEIDYKLIDVL